MSASSSLEYKVTRYLERKGPATSSQVAQDLDLTNAAINACLRRLLSTSQVILSKGKYSVSFDEELTERIKSGFIARTPQGGYYGDRVTNTR